MENKIELKVNDQVIALNPFVKKILSGVVLGAVQSLDKIPQPWSRIEITLQAEKKKGGRLKRHEILTNDRRKMQRLQHLHERVFAALL
jgi:hypothetical protein